jgi:adenylylsulfate kinase
MKTIWLIGPSGAGKTTIGKELKNKLEKTGRQSVLIDGDELRNTICKDLGFSYHDRLQQTIRASYMAKAVNQGGAWAIVCLITPFQEFREKAREIIGDNISIVYLESSKETRIERDPKGLYKKAIAGELDSKLTGYDGVFDIPQSKEALTISTDSNKTIDESVDEIISVAIGNYFSQGDGI